MTAEPDSTPDEERLARRLGRLAVRPPVALTDRLVARAARTEGPAGPCFVAFTSAGICLVELAGRLDDNPGIFAEVFRNRFGLPLRPVGPAPRAIADALGGSTRTRVAFDLSRSSAFERDVLEKTLEIPRGEVRPYSWVAAEIGRPAAVRAVGTALGHNPIPFLIPCHRVVRNDGSIGNYGFGPDVKARLLEAEGVALDDAAADPRPVGPRFVGSTTTGIVCYPTCGSARRIADRNRVPFPSVEAAQAAGFRPCARCRPVTAPRRQPS